MTRPGRKRCVDAVLKGLSLRDMAGGKAEGTVIRLDTWRGGSKAAGRPAKLFTIKQVREACGLPGPVIMQLAPRTWIDGAGWMYTAEQLRAAIEIAEELRRARVANEPRRQPDPNDVIVCESCDAMMMVDETARARWLHVVAPDSSGRADPAGRDYCPDCVIPCPTCRATDSEDLCPGCFGAGRVPLLP